MINFFKKNKKQARRNTFRYPILLNYDHRQFIGWVEIDADELSKEKFESIDGVIAPQWLKQNKDAEWQITHFGLISRMTVNTKAKLRPANK
jgi:hypothetical protein